MVSVGLGMVVHATADYEIAALVHVLSVVSFNCPFDTGIYRGDSDLVKKVVLFPRAVLRRG